MPVSALETLIVRPLAILIEALDDPNLLKQASRRLPLGRHLKAPTQVVWDFTSCELETGIRSSWQWQLVGRRPPALLTLPQGAVSVTMTWLNLLSLIRKMPFVGIYVVMFTDVFRTFFKVSGVVLLFVISFSFGFCALLENQVTDKLL